MNITLIIVQLTYGLKFIPFSNMYKYLFILECCTQNWQFYGGCGSAPFVYKHKWLNGYAMI